MKEQMINVIGLGYIGLPTALSLAYNDYTVVGTDCDIDLIENLKIANIKFNEEGIDALFTEVMGKNIQFTTEYIPSDIYIVAVPTPYNKNDKKIDASFLVDAVKKVMEVCQEESIIVIESTISPGTIDKYIRPLIHKKKVYLAHAPERIIPGNILKELRENSRIIGADNNEVAETIRELYSSFCRADIVITDIRTAEMTKVIENTYRDINIAFANELAQICYVANLDVYEIIKIANMHPRVNILKPGPGVGGHCISVDPWFLVGDYPGLANIILTARKINDSMPEFVLKRIRDIMTYNNIYDLAKVGFYGLTYKENVDDTRESPTLQLIECMKNHLATNIKVYDPFVKKRLIEEQYFSFDEFLNDIDMIVVMVGHDEIIQKQNQLYGKIVFDTRNVIRLEGIYYL